MSRSWSPSALWNRRNQRLSSADMSGPIQRLPRLDRPGEAQWGEAAVAAIVLQAGATLTADDVIGYLRQHLAAYKKPRHVVFMDALPRTAASQQIHKPMLRELVLQRIT